MPARLSRAFGVRFTAARECIVGCDLQLVPARRRVQAWRASDRPKGAAFSVISLERRARGTERRRAFTQHAIPERTKNGPTREAWTWS
jgi:hypothetical protein